MWASGGRLLLLCALLVVGGSLAGSSPSKRNRQQSYDREYDDQDDQYDSDNGQQQQQQQQPKPFESGKQYTYTYDAQMATGLAPPDAQQCPVEQNEPQQKAMSRIQAQAQIIFQSSNQAVLRLQQVRIGQLNKHIEQPEQVQPMGMFDERDVNQDKLRQLQLPLKFEYNQGMVANVQFHEEDRAWSKNIKRSVLNLIQLNLKESQTRDEQDEDGNRDGKSKGYTVQEMTIEGDCQTIYTINRNRQSGQGNNGQDSQGSEESQQLQQQQDQNTFNVTKSVNFKLCKKVADVAHGYQTEQEQPECVKCQQEWYKQLNGQQSNGKQQQQQQPQPQQCEQCDPKEIKDQRLDRTTVLRYTLTGQPNKFAIKRAELVSQYLYKTMRSQNGPYGSALQAIASAQLVFRRVQEPKDNQQQQQQLQKIGSSNGKKNTLLYDNEWDVDEKRFYMDGDDEFARNGPFANVANKVEQAQQILRKLITAASDKTNGVEFDQLVHIQRLVEVFRMCTVEELNQIQSIVTSDGKSTSLRSESERKKAEQIITDALAIAGTRNTIFALADKINNGELDAEETFQSLKSLNGLVAPSDKQVDIILSLCQSQKVPTLKQTCWLTFGSMVGELCQKEQRKNQRDSNNGQQQGQQQQVFGSQTGFQPKKQMCQGGKKESYKQALVEQYNQAQNNYEKVLALKALGNAGMDTSVMDLEQIIKDQREDRGVRCQAIDSLRRLRAQMPRKIQRCLLPIFQNTKEQPAVRMCAFHMLMQTQPEEPIVDQVTYTLIKERHPDVQSFVYTTMQVLSKSKVPCQQQIAKHLKNALKLVNVDEQSLRPTRHYQVPIYSDEHQEGVFVNLNAVFNSREMLPNYVSASMDTLLNDQYDINQIRVSASQSGIEQWYEQLTQALSKIASQRRSSTSNSQQQQTRGQHRSSSYSRYNDPQREMRNIRSTLNIKNRGQHNRNNDNKNNRNQEDGQELGNRNDQAFAMVCVRMGDMDRVILPLDRHTAPRALKRMLDGEQPSLRELIQGLKENKPFRILTAINLNEKTAKVPTSIGLPLRVQQSTPLMVSLEGNVRVNMEDGEEVKATVNAHPAISLAHIQKMECWLPIMATGVVNTQAIEMSAPIQAEIKADDGIKITLKCPQVPKTRLFGLHSLPATYTADWDSRMNMQREPKVKAIHNHQLEQLQRDIDQTVGEHTTGMPFRINGHYHRPSSLTDFKNSLQLMMATENHVHVTYEPSDSSPKQVVLRFKPSAFQKADEQENQPQLDNFHTNSAAFGNSHPEDNFEDMESDNQEQSRSKLNAFTNKFQTGQMYQHGMTLSAETQQGRKQCRAELKVKSACDASFKFCKASVEMKRSPMYANEGSDWELTSNIQMLRPDTVTNVQQLAETNDDDSDSKNRKFILKAETEWGTDEKQEVNLKVQGQKAQSQQHRSRMQDYEGAQKRYQQKRAAFINRFDVVAEYKLKKYMQNAANRAMELLKTYHFWNTESKPQANGREDLMKATVVIDPIGQQHANISVTTPYETVRIRSAELPLPIRPFSLVRQSSKPMHSTHEFLGRVVRDTGRAECTISGKQVTTFDGSAYTAPLGKCYSVVAKDCRSSEPRFVVMMKAVDDLGKEKKVMVIAQDQTIECQPDKSQGKTKLKCTINGEKVSNNDNGNRNGNSRRNDYDSSADQQQQQSNNQNADGQQIVEWNSEDQSDVTINVQGVSVRLGCWCDSCKCQKAWIKISNQYKEGQCGLCGHYDDDSDNDLRMGNNEQTDDLVAFHRSYSFKDSECSDSDQNDVYENKKDKFKRLGMKHRMKKNAMEDDEEEESNQQDQEWRAGNYASDDNDSLEDQMRSSWRSSNTNNKRNRGQKNKSNKRNGAEPIEQTKVIEYNHKVCFSTQPVKQCPEGTTPDEQDSAQQQQQKKVQFVCLPRSSAAARRMQSEARKGKIVDVEGRSATFNEPLSQPSRCVAY